MGLADAAAVLIEGDIANVVEAVFDGPMTAAEVEQAGGVGFAGDQAGDAVNGFAVRFGADQVGGVALDAEDLADVGEVQIIVEFGAGPDLADFQAAVGLIGGGVFWGEKSSSGARRCPGASRADCP